MLIESIAAVLLAYLLGMFPTAYVVSRLSAGVDIRRLGSENHGALNTYRQVGAKAGLTVLAVDGAKGALTVIVAEELGAHEYVIYLAALMATLGHNFTPLLGFKGGKGGATVLGISVAMMWELTAVSLAVGLALLAISRHVVWSITGAFVALNALTILTSQPAGMVGLCLSLSLVVAGTHLYPEHHQLVPAVKRRQWRRFMSVE